MRAGASHHDEMCNLYMMVSSELPYFMSCKGGVAAVSGRGAGGIPAPAHLEADRHAAWRPPQQASAHASAGIRGSWASAGTWRHGVMGGKPSCPWHVLWQPQVHLQAGVVTVCCEDVACIPGPAHLEADRHPAWCGAAVGKPAHPTMVGA